MNKKQMIVMWVGIIVVVLMGIFPPWVTSKESTPVFLGYDFILLPVTGDAGQYIAIIDLTRLLTQWTMVALIAGGLIITFKNKRDGKLKDEQREIKA